MPICLPAARRMRKGGTEALENVKVGRGHPPKGSLEAFTCFPVLLPFLCRRGSTNPSRNTWARTGVRRRLCFSFGGVGAELHASFQRACAHVCMWVEGGADLRMEPCVGDFQVCHVPCARREWWVCASCVYVYIPLRSYMAGSARARVHSLSLGPVCTQH